MRLTDLIGDGLLNEDNIFTEGGGANIEPYVDIRHIDVGVGNASNVTEQVDSRDRNCQRQGNESGEVIIEVARVSEIGGSDNQAEGIRINNVERQGGIEVKGNREDRVDVAPSGRGSFRSLNVEERHNVGFDFNGEDDGDVDTGFPVNIDLFTDDDNDEVNKARQ